MLAKARIVNVQTNESVECMFNPKEFVLTKQNNWNGKSAIGQNIPHLLFEGGNSATLKLKLLFDTYEDHDSVSRPTGGTVKDVRVHTQRLWDMMKIPDLVRNPETNKGEPPHCRFHWGPILSFEAVIESISETFILFSAEGMPLRSTLEVAFKQIEESGKFPRQNPTSGGGPGEHLYTVREGETLAGIAYEAYGDATAWRHLALTNGISDPRRLRPGQVLLVKPLPPL
ncbi:MAG: LysM peptidoglycan-binding domain-containing protein [Chloroflexales bacterium]|nr:LysM peptidoglycan-binding domain-containing protein [Chloroflexales bacterium]